MSKYSEQGFTLIELMISIILALLIAAAALALFLGSSRNLRIQESADDVQEAAVFSLTQMENEISMANLGSVSLMKQNTPWTGILFTGYEGTNSSGQFLGNVPGKENKTKLSIDVLTKSGKDLPASLGHANIKGNVKSDQLVIQYQAPFDTQTCNGLSVKKGDMVVERYFTRKDTIIANNEKSDSNNLSIVLACDAEHYFLKNGTSTEMLTNDKEDIEVIKKITDALTGDGEVIINRVDYFAIRLGVLRDNGVDYMTISDYMKKVNGRYSTDAPIVAIKMAVIVRGINSVGTDTLDEFTIFGDTVAIKNTANNYVRRAYEKTIMLRNNMVGEASNINATP